MNISRRIAQLWRASDEMQHSVVKKNDVYRRANDAASWCHRAVGLQVSSAPCIEQRLALLDPRKDEGCFSVIVVRFPECQMTGHCLLDAISLCHFIFFANLNVFLGSLF